MNSVLAQLVNTFVLAVLCISSTLYANTDTKPFEIPRSEVHTIHSKILSRSYKLYVKLPFGYTEEKNLKRSYPTVYLNDGPYTFQVASGVTRLPQGAKKFEPTILVGISFAEGDNGQFSRVRDLTLAEDKSWKKYETGGAPAYLSFIESEVIPFIEKTYRSDSKNRTLSGQSLGGSFGAFALVTKPELFKNYLLTSSSLWLNNRLIFELEEQYAKNNTDLKANVYFAVGSLETKESGMNYEMVSLQQEFTAKLRSRAYPNLRVKDEIIEGSIHETTFPIGFTRGAKWLYGY